MITQIRKTPSVMSVMMGRTLFSYDEDLIVEFYPIRETSKGKGD